MNPANFDRLAAEGLIRSDYEFADDDRQVIETLSPEEVDTIIMLVQKLSPTAAASASGEIGGVVQGIIL